MMCKRERERGGREKEERERKTGERERGREIPTNGDSQNFYVNKVYIQIRMKKSIYVSIF